MPKYSFIIPVYNTEKYLERCLDSVLNQSINDYEVIIVNDGSTDNSKKTIDKYLSDERLKYIYQENQGLSEARNTGIKIATGKYILFLDSDDYISYQMLEELDKNFEEDIDVLKFECKYVYETETKDINDNINITGKGYEVLEKLITSQSLIEPAWLYAYKREFFVKNEFKYMRGIYHEDFALTPYILTQASKVKVINKCLYYYVQVSNSITRNNDYVKTKKKVYDMYTGFKYNYENVNKDLKLPTDFKNLFNSYLANIVIKKGQDLNLNDQREYYSKLSKEKIYDLLLSNTIKRRLKKIILKLNRKIYFKIFK